ncbi:putative RNA-directed DNA polymerase from transposon X-element [Araneus ventricosus]|uniref:Putative RNA-directed DNA polymerase from transposon X-element n=2 Tax=Araneus ventricosus TaxID=182803 RepID=A0A4Y2B8U6_ARAVE|nr:putative RNA-directed DNA polymerase from transposon X-element [Araneus ventricosus]
MACVVSWNCRGFHSKVCHIKDMIYEMHPVCIALQETYLKPADIAKIKRYSLVRKDNENESGRASGGVALLVSHDTPSSVVTLHTNLQAVAVRVMLSNLVTVCTLYLPPSTSVNDRDLNRLVDELPTPFIIIGDFNAKDMWENVRRACGIYPEKRISCLRKNGQEVRNISEMGDVLAEAFASICSASNCTEPFLTHKNRLERIKLRFQTTKRLSYNTDLTIFELHTALSVIKHTSPGPDEVTYSMLQHLSEHSLLNTLYMFNHIWKEHVFPDCWKHAFIISILKPGKDPQNLLNYRPIALTSCMCKLFERIVNVRLVHILEKNEYISPFQSGFRKSRSTIDNLISLETDIRVAFLKRNHLVSIFFDIYKAYDRTWRYGIMKNLYDLGFRGNLPIFVQNFLKQRILESDSGILFPTFFARKKVFLRAVF